MLKFTTMPLFYDMPNSYFSRSITSLSGEIVYYIYISMAYTIERDNLKMASEPFFKMLDIRYINNISLVCNVFLALDT